MRIQPFDDINPKLRKPATKTTDKSYEKTISTAGAGDPKQVKPAAKIAPKKKS